MHFKKYWHKVPLGFCILAMAGFGVGCSGDNNEEIPSSPKTEKIKLADGFRVEHLHSPSDHGEGSWVSMAFDDKGRLITSDQYGYLYRTTIGEIGSKDSLIVEKLTIGADTTGGKVPMGAAQGLLYAFNSLYVVVNGPKDDKMQYGSGVYRLQDTDGDDQFDKITTLKVLDGGGEHGPHSIILSPDKNSLYIVAGNHTDLPKMDKYRLPSNWDEDNLAPLIKDPRGHANDKKAPGGWIVHTDSLGQKWELVSAGYRNPYDIAFNEAGDLFVYDADMEWDFGQPFYRPTRVSHATSGAENGWRTGSGKWHPSWADNVPAIMNIGQGSPTNLMYLDEARFPDKYKNTLLAFDWSFGIAHAMHLKADGSTYKAEHSEFLSGAPLPLTDGVIGPDGALYFLTGGRRLGSDLYRVYHKDYKKIEPGSNRAEPVITEEHKIRTGLEKYHGEKDPAAVEAAWNYLNHSDRFVRYAARIAVESQPVQEWQQRALSETDPVRLINAGLALARQGNKAQKNALFSALSAIDYDKLNEEQKNDLLRTVEVALYRLGQPDGTTKSNLLAFLDPKFPSGSPLLNRQFSKILVNLDAPKVAERILALIDNKENFDDKDNEPVTATADLIHRNPQYGLDLAGLLEKMPPAQQTFYAFSLSQLKSGWTPELSEKYFGWFRQALDFQGGRSYIGFIDRARKIALQHVPKAKFEEYNKLSGGDLLRENGNDLATQYTPKGPGRRWKLDEAVSFVQDSLQNRDFDRGKLIYNTVLCSRCHAIGGEGRDVGPDLTQLGTRFSVKDMLEAIIDPDKAVSDQYASTVYQLKDGSSIVGRQLEEDADNYHVAQNPFDEETIRKVPKKDVSSKSYSTQSMMLPGLINSLNPDELRDLIAYLMAGGNAENPIYKEAPAGK